MSRATMQLQAVWRLLQTNGPEAKVSKSWLLRTGSRLDRRFLKENSPTLSNFGDYLQIVVKNQTFLWPGSASHGACLQILSEILTPEHPHQYIYGETKIGRDDVVLDIGACEGAFSALVAGRCKHVIAIEPSKAMCDLMVQLFKIRNEPCPEIVTCLLGSEAGKTYFYENPSNPGSSRLAAEPVDGAYPVPIRTLDELAESLGVKPTFIKCDAEGAELSIFSGGRNFLRSHRPKLAITTYHNDGDFIALYELLKSIGYSNVEGKGFLFSGEKLRVQMIHAW